MLCECHGRISRKTAIYPSPWLMWHMSLIELTTHANRSYNYPSRVNVHVGKRAEIRAPD